ncbi:major capsid protein [Corynebacterium amycolatum]|uniref:major capsid protein n=1 Tax=Corynebacterium amycolatum TaxID=43765 RepID=UPI00191DA603|nr:major capsid protein [Corynebacterium amycolatum]QQU97789.1 major capsid protein [Corynebacterium amycolatum]
MASTIWNEVLSPADLTVYANHYLTELQQGEGSLASYFPDQIVNDIYFTWMTEQNTNRLAEIRSADAETPIGAMGGGRKAMMQLPLVGQKVRINEIDQLRGFNPGNSEFQEDDMLKATETVVRAVANRVEVARGDVLTTGRVRYAENGAIVDAGIGRDEEFEVTPKKHWDDQNSGALEDIIDWAMAYEDANGVKPGAILASPKVVQKLQTNGQFRDAANTTGELARVSSGAINAVLQDQGLPAITSYSRSVPDGVKSRRILDENALYFLPPETEFGMLGYTVWGQTVEMNSPEYQLPGVGQIAVGAWRENDPMAYWVRANAAVQPILTNPNMAMVAHVVKPGATKRAAK